MGRSRIFKTIISLITAFILTVTALNFAGADDGDIKLYAGSAMQLKEALDKCTEPGVRYTIVITYEDITIDSGNFTQTPHIEIPEGVSIVIERSEDISYCAIRQVPVSDADLTAAEKGALIDVKGSLTLSGVTLNASSNGRAAYIESTGSLTIYAGVSVINGLTRYNGGGIYLDGGTLNLAGGEIKNNSALLGGGVYIHNGTANILGGVISGNSTGSTSVKSEGIYFGSHPENALQKQASLRIGGNPSISDTLFIEEGLSLTIARELGSNKYKISQEYSDYGVILAEYMDSAAASKDDAAKFVSIGNYAYKTDEKEGAITVSAIDIGECIVDIKALEYKYTGNDITPEFTVLSQGGNVVNDYTVLAEDLKTPGQKSVVIKGDGIRTLGNATFSITITGQAQPSEGSSQSSGTSSGSGTSSNSGKSSTSGSGSSSSQTQTKDTETKDGKVLTCSESSYNCVLSDGSLIPEITNSGNARLKYSSSDPEVAAVNSLGKLSLKGCGSAEITVSADKTKDTDADELKIMVYVKPDIQSVRYVRALEDGSVKMSWMQDPSVDGYQIRLSADKEMADARTVTITSWKQMECEIGSLEDSRTWYIQLRGYKQLGGTNTILCSEWSGTETVKIR